MNTNMVFFVKYFNIRRFFILIVKGAFIYKAGHELHDEEKWEDEGSSNVLLIL